MTGFREWALMLVFIALSSFIYWYLLPSGRISETAKAIVSVLAVAAVCIPVFSFIGRADVSLSSFMSEDGETSVFEPSDVYLAIAENTVNEKIELIVKKYTTNGFFIKTDMNISEDHAIDIKQVSVCFEKYPEKLPELSLEIEEALGIPPVFSLKVNEDAEEQTDRKTEE